MNRGSTVSSRLHSVINNETFRTGSATMAKAKMNEDSRTMYLARALYDAVEDSNIQQVNSLLSQKKANPNILIPEEMMTPFHLAAGHENLAFGKVVTSLFLHNGGDPNVLCEGNRTVLHIAVAWNRSSVVEILLNSPYIIPNPFIKDEDNLSVFNYAIKFSAWESLAILQSIMKRPNFTSNLKNQICKSMESVHVENDDSVVIVEQETVKSNCAELTFDKSNKLNASSGYFNSGESLDNSSKSTKCDSISKINNDNLNLSSAVDSFHDILNSNILPDNNSTELPGCVSTNINLDDSVLSSIKLLNDDYEDLENVSFPSNNLDVDPELFEINEDEIAAENISGQMRNIRNNNSELMTDISGLSSIFTDDFFTCPDSSSEENLNSSSIDTDLLLAEIASCLSMTSFSDSMSKSISKNSVRTNNLDISNRNINSEDGGSNNSIAITEDYDTDFVRQSLRSLGQPPGPLVPSTKRLYVRKLSRLLKNQADIKEDDNHIETSSGSYSSELTKVLTPDDYNTWKTTIKSWRTLEESIVAHKSGSSFTYLLLDPRITRNLPARADHFEDPIQIWQTFIKSIFYIGKGTKSRPNDHMNEALQSWTEKKKKKRSQKTEYILNIWKNKMGVVCLQAFHHLELKEAHIREAAMIDAIGLDKLTNEKRGTYYDHTIRWRNSDRCKLGCHLLYRAMLVFLADGERQLRPIDLT